MKIPGLVFMVLICVGWAVNGQQYKIEMHRVPKVGQRFEISYRVQDTQRASAHMGPRSTPEYKTNKVAELDALIEVLETNSKGRITQASCTISNCVRIDDKERRELLPRDAIVQLVPGQEGPRFVLNNKPLHEDAEEIIEAAMALEEGDFSRDEIFGTDGAKKVGDTWAVRPEYLAWLLKKGRVTIANQAIEGRTTLEAVVKVGQIECLELASKVYLKKLVPPLPKGVELKQGFGALRLTGKFPLDTSMSALEEGVELDNSFVLYGGPGSEMAGISTRVTSNFKQTLRRRYLN